MSRFQIIEKECIKMDKNSMQIALGKLSPQDNDVVVVKFNKEI